MIQISPIDWDSKFFGLKIGSPQGESSDIPKIIQSAKDQGYDLIILRSQNDPLIAPEQSYSDTKIVFTKDLKSDYENDPQIFSGLNIPLTDDLVALSLEAGSYSRFKQDENFGIESFNKLYKEWIRKSLTGDLADEVFLAKQNSAVTGLVTVRLKDGFSEIGLLSVKPGHQGQGIGSRLMKAAETFSISRGILKLKVPTQLVNQEAVRFYLKSGFMEESREQIVHLWIKDF